MTEENIIKSILPPHKTPDYPKLNPDSAATIARNFTDIIYDTLKLKSIGPTNKRLNILQKFVQNLASSPTRNHLEVDENNYELFIKSLGRVGQVESPWFEHDPPNLRHDIEDFARRRNESIARKGKLLAQIQELDQQSLDNSNFPAKINKLPVATIEISPRDKDTTTPSDYRLKQVKYAYALLHLNQWSSLEKVVEHFCRVSTNLKGPEINFLVHLFESGALPGDLWTRGELFVVFEVMLVRLCTELLKLRHEECVFEHRVARLRTLCSKSVGLRCRVSDLLMDLYGRSCCNSNLLKLHDFLM